MDCNCSPVWSGLSDLSVEEVDALIGPVIRYLFKFDNNAFKEVQLVRDTLGFTDPRALHVRTGFVGMKYAEHMNIT